MTSGAIALFEFEWAADEIRIASEKHYRLVPSDQIEVEDLDLYRVRAE